jgi:hypothetical protein
MWRYTNHWKGDMPTLFDVLAVDLVNPRKPYRLKPLNIEVAPDGLTRPVEGTNPNAQVALEVDATTFMNDFVDLLIR